MVSTLAPDAAHGLDCARTGDHHVVVVALADAEVARHFVRGLRAVSNAMLVLLAEDPLDPGEVAELGVHAQMPAGSQPGLVSAQAVVLLSLAGTLCARSHDRGGPLVLDGRPAARAGAVGTSS